MNDSGFSRRKAHRLRYFISLRVRSSHRATAFPSALVLPLHRAFHSRLLLPSRVPTVLSHRSTGISTCCPSATASALALGPDSPRADQLYPGNLGYTAWMIHTSISLLIPAFSLLSTPQPLTVLLRRAHDAPLPIINDSNASVLCFSPGHFRRKTSRPVSYYALFQ